MVMNALTASFSMLALTEVTFGSLTIPVLGILWAAPPMYMVKKAADLTKTSTDAEGDSSSTE
jgi:hypothetical protein